MYRFVTFSFSFSSSSVSFKSLSCILSLNLKPVATQIYSSIACPAQNPALVQCYLLFQNIAKFRMSSHHVIGFEMMYSPYSISPKFLLTEKVLLWFQQCDTFLCKSEVFVPKVPPFLIHVQCFQCYCLGLGLLVCLVFVLECYVILPQSFSRVKFLRLVFLNENK